MRSILKAGIGFFLVMLALAACAPQAATTTTPPTAAPSATATMAPQPLPNNLDLTSISMISPAEGWAVGHTTPLTHYPNSNEPGKNYVDPVLLHHEQGRWSQAALPTFNPNWGAIELNSIVMVSANEGWAVGNSVLPPNANGVQVGIVLHFLNGQWAVTYEHRASRISAVFMRSASDGWMVGISDHSQQQQALLLHYDGSQWVSVFDSVFAHIVPDTVAGVSANSIWVTGTDYSRTGPDGGDPGRIFHYNGTRWTRESVNLSNARLVGFGLMPSGEGWVVGGLPGGAGPYPTKASYGLILHYDNGVWKEQARIKAPPDNSYFILSSVAMVSSGEGWIVGPNGTILHYQAGAWSQVASPTTKDLSSVVMLSANEGWAVGVQSTLLHYVNGTWSQVND